MWIVFGFSPEVHLEPFANVDPLPPSGLARVIFVLIHPPVVEMLPTLPTQTLQKGIKSALVVHFIEKKLGPAL